MADVTQAQANQRRTELDVSRYAPLAKDVSVSQQEFDAWTKKQQTPPATPKPSPSPSPSASPSAGPSPSPSAKPSP